MNNKRLMKVIGLLAVVALLAAALPLEAKAQTVNEVVYTVCSEGCDHTTIQDAVLAVRNLTDPGTLTTYRIAVGAGVYDTASTIDIVQQNNKNIILDGASKDSVTIKDQIRIDGNSRHAAVETVTIQDFTFDFSDLSGDIITTSKIVSPTYVYAHNITVKDCKFLGNEDLEKYGKVVAIRAAASGGHTNFVLENLEGVHIHSLLQATSVTLPGVTVKNSTVTDSLSGLNLLSTTTGLVDGFTFNGDETGIRTQFPLTVKNSSIISSGDTSNLADPKTAIVTRFADNKTITIENSVIKNTVAGNYAIANATTSPASSVTLVIKNVDTGGGSFDLSLVGGLGPVILGHTTDQTTTYTSFATIQSAIDAASTGDTINVAPGTYSVTSTINVNVPVTISGAGIEQTFVKTEGTDSDPVNIFNVSVDDVTISNMTIQHKKSSNTSVESAIVLSNASGPNYTPVLGFTLDSCRVEYMEFAVTLRGGDWTLSNNEFVYTGVIDNSNRIIGVYGTTGTNTANNNSFIGSDNTSGNTDFIYLTSSSLNETYGGTLQINGNTQTGGNIRHFYIQDVFSGTGLTLFADGNSTTALNGNFVLYGASTISPFDHFTSITLLNNSVSNVKGKGLLALDGDSGLKNAGSTTITMGGNTLINAAITAEGYLEATGSIGGLIGYESSVFYDPNVTVKQLVTYVDDDYTAATPGWGVTHFATIQDGIDAVAEGGTVNVAAGTYAEDVVVTDKFFNLIGAVDTNGDPVSILEGSLSIDNPSYYDSGTPEFSTIKNIYFERTDSHLLILKNFNGGLIENCVFDGNDGFMEHQFNGVNLVSGPNGNSNITVKSSTFKDGLYVGINGYTGGLTVIDSIFTNVKSGINLQGGAGNTLTIDNSDFSVIAQGETNDTYGVRFASEGANTGGNLTITNSSFVVDKNGFVAEPETYHSAIIIRAGATGTLKVKNSSILGEVVNQATPVLDATYNWWGSNAGPEPGSISENVEYDPWLRFSDLTLEDNQIDENLPVGSLVGTFTFEDADPEDEFTLALVDTENYPDNASFTIDGYDLKSAEVFDFETKDTYSIRVQVTDDSGAIFEKSFTITVNDANDAPVIAPIADQTIPEGVEWSYQVSASDEDVPAQTLTYSLEDGEEGDVPDGATIDPESGELTWNPSEAQGPGEYMFDVVVNDGVDITYLTINITVTEVNVAPVLAAIGGKSVAELALLSFNASASDADIPAQTLVFSLADGAEGDVPEGAVITPAGAFSWTPSEAQGPDEYKFDVCVSDGALSDCETITVTVTEVNVAPVLAPIGNQEKNELEALTFTATATDADIPVQTLVFSLADGTYGEVPEGAVITAAGAFSWTPSEAQGPGDYIFDVCVSDGALSDCETITVVVNEVNVAPVLDEIGPQTVNELETLEFTATATDADIPEQELVFSLDGAPTGAVIDPETGEFSWKPGEEENGTHTFGVCVSDGELEDCETITVTVNEVNVAPILDPIGNQTIAELQELAFTATASDSDIPAQSLSFSIDGLAPDGASIDPVTGEFSWIPTELEGPGEYHVYVYVTDGVLMDYERITITVTEVNVPPVLDPIGPQEVDEGSELTFTASASDEDKPDQVLEFSLEDFPEGASIDPVTGEFSWEPTEEQGPGVYFIVVCVTDGVDSTCETITVTVNEVNDAPVLAPIGNMDADELVELTFTATASDEDIPEQPLTFSLVGAPEGASIDPDTGVFSWTPNELQGDSPFTFRVVVSDGELSDYEIITVFVNETNSDPVLDPIGPQTVDEEVELSFTATASDSDVPEQTLTFSLVGAPEGASIDPATGEFSWTPTEAEDGIYTFDVCVSDGELDDCETITVTVNEVNVAPVLDPIENKVVNELVELTFTATADDADDPEQELVFSLDGAPEGAVIDPETGVFSWTPTEAQGPGIYTFSVLVSDGIEYDYQFITVTVNEVNVAPVLDPIGNKIGYPEFELTFTAHATDVDFPVQTLTYSLDGAPEGAVIDPSSGVFSWTPSETGEYTFTVLVNDGLLYDFEIITVTVEGNNPPVLDPIGDKTTNELVALTFTASASDPDEGQILTFSLVDAPEGAVINALSGAFSWTPSEAQGPGEYTFDVCVSDGALSDCETITVTVSELNVAPVLAEIGNKTIAELALLSFNASASDADLPAQPLVFSLADGVEGEVPEGAVITAAGAFTWTPTEAQGPGEYTFDVCVSDGVLSDCETITVTVSEVNVAPVLAEIGDQEVDELDTLEFVATATDADIPVQTLVFSLAGEVPEGAVITAAGAFSWTPSDEQGPGEYTFDVCVSDGILSDCETITVTVSEVNVAPVLAEIGDKSVVELALLSFNASASDADIPVQTLVFSLAGEVPEGAEITAAGAFSWTPSEEQGPGEYTFDVCVSDGSLNDCETITVTVSEANVAPVLAEIGDKSVAELALLSFNASASDADIPAQTLVFSLADGEGEVPAGAEITAAGAFSWTPSEAQGPGEYTFDVCVSDGALSDCETITVTVSEVNVAPVLAEIGDQEIDELDTLEFVATATDADIPVQTLVFSLAGEVPEGAVITAEGAFSWTPSDEQGPGEYTFDVCVSDGTLSDCETITVTVNAVNKAPVAEDMSVETMENQPVEIELIATDPDGDPLTFAIVIEPEYGTVACEESLCTYTPNAGWSGTDFFTYIANDGELDSNEATVEITVHPLPVFRIYLPLILK